MPVTGRDLSQAEGADALSVEVNPEDAVEQQRDLIDLRDDSDVDPEQAVTGDRAVVEVLEADEADLAEQRTTVDDDFDGYDEER